MIDAQHVALEDPHDRLRRWRVMRLIGLIGLKDGRGPRDPSATLGLQDVDEGILARIVGLVDAAGFVADRYQIVRLDRFGQADMANA
ncbi:MAG: hypothetical protein E6471_07075, partial [Bradyrhizobium sp.]|nr:hypothetical protein [Bradyrhizobium sp.]